MSANRQPLTHWAAWIVVAAVLGGCAQLQPGPPVDAPTLRVGDRWVYRAEDGYRVRIAWDETHEIVAIGPDGITVRVTLKGDRIDLERIEKWDAPGVVREGAVYEAETRQFDPALLRYRYPLVRGGSWLQRLQDPSQPPGPYGPLVRHVDVDGYEAVETPAGSFNAIRMRVIMQLDDETFWRFPTQCDYVIWYAPEVGAMVREDKRSSYRDKGGDDPASYHPGQNAQLRLVSYSRGR